MNKKLLLLISFFLSTAFWIFSTSSFAAISSIGFWRQQLPKLAIPSAATNTPVGVCSTAITVRTQNASGVNTNVTSNLTVNLATTAGLTFYSDENCSTAITSIVVPTGSSYNYIYVMKAATGSETITISAAGYTSYSQSATGSTNAFVWTGGGGNALWATGANWSGGAAPGASNEALFDGTCSANCSPTIAANISIKGIRIKSGYTGTITQNSGVTITLDTAGWVQADGTFAGGDSNFILWGGFYLSGGTFTSTSGTMSVYRKFTIANSPTFNHNSGTVNFGTAQVDDGISGTDAIGFYDVNFVGNGSSAALALNSIINAAGSVVLVDVGYGSSLVGTGTVRISQNLTIQGASWGVGNTVVFKMVGTGTITGSGAGSAISSLTIDTLGTTTFATTGSLDIAGDFLYLAGTVITTGSTVRFVGSNQAINSGAVIFQNVVFLNRYNAYITFTLTGTMTVAGDLTYSCSGYSAAVNSGTIDVSGNFYLIGSDFSGGTTLVRMVGTGTIYGTNSGSASGPLEIATAGTITFSNAANLDIRGNFTYTSGTVVTTGSTVRFVAIPVTVNSGAMSFNNLTFYQGLTSNNTITGTVKVDGNLSFNGLSYWPTSNGGTIEVLGNLSVAGTWGGGTTAIVAKGAGVKTVTRANSAYFPGTNITVNNAATVLTLASNWTLNTTQGIDVTAGSVDVAGYALSMKTLALNGNTLTKNGGTVTVNGSVIGTGSLYGGTVDP